jgi:uncharacterized protein YqeY
MLEERINQDLKSALLSGDKSTVNALRNLKSAILYSKLGNKQRDQPLDDSVLVPILVKEAKKRQESADFFIQGGNKEKADAELEEKTIIGKYLPEELSEEAIAVLVDEAIKEIGNQKKVSMGEVISKVKQRSAGQADGALIARLTKERLIK